MKTRNSLRTALNLKQEDMAMLLGVSRAHWGMYEIGKRELPPRASQLLFELLEKLETTEAVALTAPQHKQQNEKEQQLLTQLLRENQYQQQKLARTIATTQTKQTAQLGLSVLMDHFADTKSRKPKNAEAERPYQVLKALHKPADNHTATLLQQQIKLQTLQFEQKLLESKLQNQKP
jgi:transcriptional regulator with XRE-family HTH domain